MRRGRLLIFLGLILALGTAFVVFMVLRNIGATPAAPTIPKEEVVVAVQPIAEDEPLEGRVALQERPVDIIPPDAVRSLAATAGMLAAGPIPQGTIIHPSLMISPEARRQEGELGKLVQPGFVAVAFPIDELSSVSYGIRPGDRVDVLMTFNFIDLDQEYQVRAPVCPVICPGLPGSEGELITFGAADRYPRLVAQLTLQDVEVLGVGRWAQPTPAVTEQETKQQSKETTPTTVEIPGYITLMLTPQDALVLKLAREYRASIDLAVRAKDDHQQFTTSQVTLDYILARFSVTLPSKQNYTIEELKGIRPAGPE